MSNPIGWIDLLEEVASPTTRLRAVEVWTRFLQDQFGLPGCRLVSAAWPEEISGEEIFQAPDGQWRVFCPHPDAWREQSSEAQEIIHRLTRILAERVQDRPSQEAQARDRKDEEPVFWQEQRLVAIGALAAEMAHEIRNPLTVISMLFHNLGLDYEKDDPRMRDIQVIQQKMADLNGIVERILDLARVHTPNFERQQVEELVEDVLLLVRFKASQSGVRVHRLFGKGLPPAEVDAGMVRQAILNLVMNALEAMPDGGDMTVRIGLREAGPQGSEAVSISVEDTGRGLTDEDYQNLFKPFLSRREGGLGLGLSIVQKVVDLHRGGVEVEGEESQGACFRLLFPLKQDGSLD
jgi:signal transduction histidine kinase